MHTAQHMIKDGSPDITGGVSIFTWGRELFCGTALLVASSFVPVRLVCVSYIYPDVVWTLS